jgi:hypothetical protein
MEYSGAGGKLIHEKNQKQKSRDTVPLNKHRDHEISLTNLSNGLRDNQISFFRLFLAKFTLFQACFLAV